MNEKEKEINAYFLDQMPNIMYHGSSGKRFSKDNFLEEVHIYKNIDELNEHLNSNAIAVNGIKRLTDGRINLDAAFSGFYLTPDINQAKSWANRLAKGHCQIIKVRVNKEALLANGIACFCFPNLEWARFVIENRQEHTLENLVECSYTLMLDGNLKDSSLSEDIQKCKLPYVGDVIARMRQEFFTQFIANDLTWDYDQLMRKNDFMTGKYFQLCISSTKLLKYIEVVGIMDLEKEGYDVY